MQAVEFDAVIKGGMIQLPDNLRNFHPEHLKIIALFSEKPSKMKKRKNSFSAVKLDTKNFKFDRNDLYER